VHKSLGLKAKPLSLLPIQEADFTGFGWIQEKYVSPIHLGIMTCSSGSSGRRVMHVEQPWALVTRQQAMENWPRYWLVYVQTHESCRPETWQKQVRLYTPSCRAPSRIVQIHMYTHSYKLALQLGTGNYTIKTTLHIQDWLLSNSYLFHKEYIDIKKWFTGFALHIILIFLF